MAKVGRPTKANKESLEKAKYYLDHYEEMGDPIPSAAGLAVYLGVSKRTLYDWKDNFGPEFSHMLQELNTRQEQALIRGGISGKFNSTIAKLVLAKQGYSDKIDQTSSDGSMSPKSYTIERVVVYPDERQTN